MILAYQLTKQTNKKMEKTLEFIQKQIDDTYEGIDVLMDIISKADSVDEIVKLGRRLSKAHGKIEAFLEVKKQLLDL